MLMNAKDKKLSQSTSGLPNLSQAVTRFFQPMVFLIMQKTLVEGRTQSIPLKVLTQGTKQPFSPQQLKVKPEGSRAWSWYMIHTTDDLGVKVNDKMLINGQCFKVMAESNFNEYGYFYYEIIESTING